MHQGSSGSYKYRDRCRGPVMGCCHPSQCSVQRFCVKVVAVAEGLSWGVATLPHVLYRDLECVEVVAVAEGLSWGVTTLPCVLYRELSCVEVVAVAEGLSWGVTSFLSVLCRDLVLMWSLLQRACLGVLPPFPVFCTEILC